MRVLAIVLTLLSLSLAVKAQTPQFPIAYSTEKEAALGAQLAAEVRRQTTPLNLIAVENYATNIGLRLAPLLPNSPTSWQFRLIKSRQGSSTHEPISLPGGWIFIPSQLILSAHTESEFAAMLAHAMAHVALRQMTRQVSANPNTMASIPLVFMGGPAFAEDDNQLVPRSYLKTQHQFELDADQVAVRALVAAGFDPTALLSYVERIQFPPVPERIAGLRQDIRDQTAFQPSIVSTDLFQSIQEQVHHELSSTRSTPKLPSLAHPDN